MRSGRFRFRSHYAILVLFASRVFCASPAWPKGNGSLHNWRFMSQAISRESRDEREFPRLAIRAICRFRLASLLKRQLCRLRKQ